VNVALYARYSTDKQDARSIDDQLRRCRAFAAARGWFVVAEHHDAAASGASRARPGLKRLLDESKRKAFEAVIVDDLSRLSRDLGNTWNIVFGDLATVGVRVIDATTGMASDAAGARLTFGALALVNDAFLQLVKTETHRGLEGRALAGFWTGGSCYGYRTVPESNPQDPEHPRAVLVIEPDEAAVVRDLFEKYAAGESLMDLLRGLTGRKAPADGAAKKGAPGWSKSLLHAMLRNERYAGRFVWNKRKWMKDPASGKRRCVSRPEAEWVRTERPDLAIVSPDLWGRVQARHAGNARPSNRKRESTGYALSGLLRCGVCGGAMSVVSRRLKEGVAYAQFGCSTRHSRGESGCSNKRTIAERTLNVEVLTAVRKHLASPEVARWLSDVAADVEARRARGASSCDGHARLAADLAAAEARIEKVADAVARIGYSEPLERKLRVEEERARGLRAELAKSAGTPKRVARPRLSAIALLARLDDLAEVAARKPRQARAGLAEIVEGIVLTPQASGRVKATLRLKSETAALAGDRSGFELTGCGGRI
jgi:site-specific DNA recombinase